jgi:serine/threonine protein phosphatase PrpC
MRFSIIQESRIGARPLNQDRVGHWRTGESLLMVVADGMGGHPRGELAAELAVAHFASAFRSDARPRLADPAAFLARGLSGCHATILRRAAELGLPEAPRTTAVACVIQDGTAYWSHIGDSRLYIVRGGKFLARTRDHTPVQRLVDAGRIREEAVPSHPDRNKLLQCLGGDLAPRLEPEASARLAKNDIVLLCSDGLWGPLTPRQLLTALLATNLHSAVRELIELAEKYSGVDCDNVSVLALSWGEDEVPAAEDLRGMQIEESATVARDFTATQPDYMRTSDAEIDQAIEEIKAALRKHTGSR